MVDEEGNELSEKEILKTAMDHIAEACCFLFECDSPEIQVIGALADTLLKLGNVIMHDESPLTASVGYDEFAEQKYLEFIKKSDQTVNLS